MSGPPRRVDWCPSDPKHACSPEGGKRIDCSDPEKHVVTVPLDLGTVTDEMRANISKATSRALKRQTPAALAEERDTWRLVATRLARSNDEIAQSAFNAAVREYGHPDYPKVAK